MNISESERQTVESVMRAMQQGREGEQLMMSLFNDDATFIEPFTGMPRTHQGLVAIREAFLDSTSQSPPDLNLKVDRLDKEEDTLRAAWSCTSSAFPTPMKGVDLFQLRAGKIQRLEVTVTEMPDFGGGHP